METSSCHQMPRTSASDIRCPTHRQSTLAPIGADVTGWAELTHLPQTSDAPPTANQYSLLLVQTSLDGRSSHICLRHQMPHPPPINTRFYWCRRRRVGGARIFTHTSASDINKSLFTLCIDTHTHYHDHKAVTRSSVTCEVLINPALLGAI